jgi:hypothetical protein
MEEMALMIHTSKEVIFIKSKLKCYHARGIRGKSLKDLISGVKQFMMFHLIDNSCFDTPLDQN